MMEYLGFSFFFILSHILAYTIAGVIALGISKDIYESKARLCDFLRDMADKQESKHVSRYFLPAQIIRGLLMSVILFPLLPAISDFPFHISSLFFAGLMFVFTHLAAASPFIDNIEGWVYFKKKYIRKSAIAKFQTEMLTYAVLFGLLISMAIEWIL
ncbi:MAG: hypothetical protein ACQES0_06810 [Bacteroidota bacterium]